MLNITYTLSSRSIAIATVFQTISPVDFIQSDSFSISRRQLAYFISILVIHAFHTLPFSQPPRTHSSEPQPPQNSSVTALTIDKVAQRLAERDGDMKGKRDETSHSFWCPPYCPLLLLLLLHRLYFHVCYVWLSFIFINFSFWAFLHLLCGRQRKRGCDLEERGNIEMERHFADSDSSCRSA